MILKGVIKRLLNAVMNFFARAAVAFNDIFNKGDPAGNPAGKGTTNEARPRKRLVDGLDADKFTTLCFAVVIGFVSIVGASLMVIGINSSAHELSGSEADDAQNEGSGNVIFTFGGSVIPDSDVIASAAIDGEYNFNNCLSELSELLTGDISVIGLNGQINVKDKAVKGYGSGSNYPSELASSFRDIGVNYVFGNNTSAFANGVDGLSSTVAALHDNSVNMIGVTDCEPEKLNKSVVRVNGVNVGLAGYNFSNYSAYEKQEDSVKSFASVLPQDADKAAIRVSSDITAMKNKGAEFIVLFVNWGSADDKEPSPLIKKAAELFAKSGADMVIGYGPCIPMECEVIEYVANEGGNKECYVFYSLGCLFGDMTYREGYTNAMSGSMVVCVKAARGRDNKIHVKSAEYQPVYVLKNILTSGDKTHKQYISVPMMKYVAEELRPDVFPDNTQWNNCKNAFSSIAAIADKADGMLVLGDIYSDDSAISDNTRV